MYCEQYDEIYEDDSMWWAQQDEERQQWEQDRLERARDMIEEVKHVVNTI